MTSDPKNVNPSANAPVSRPAVGGSAGSDSQASTPGPGLTTGEPDRFELADKGTAAAKRLDLSKPAADKAGQGAGRADAQSGAGAGHKEPRVDAPRTFTDNRPRTEGSNLANPKQQPQPGQQTQLNPQRPASSPQSGSASPAIAPATPAAPDKSRESKPGHAL
jgi:hypothetical protein